MWGSNLFLILNIKIAIYCNLMLYTLAIPACVRRSLYEETRSLKTVRSPPTLIFSSLFLSLAQQKCHTKLQYARWGRTAVLYIRNFAFIRIRFFSLCRTPIILLVFVQTSNICCKKFRSLSIISQLLQLLPLSLQAFTVFINNQSAFTNLLRLSIYLFR